MPKKYVTNCHKWRFGQNRKHPNPLKSRQFFSFTHLTGIQEGIKLCLNQIKGDLQISPELMDEMKESGVFDRRRLLFTSQGLSAIEGGLNTFYQDSANLEIPIIAAYQHVTLELNFASARELADNLSNLRRKYNPD